MLVRIVRHWCKPGQIEAGRAHMDRVGDETAAAPGFLYRYRLECKDEPNLLTTFTVWRDQEALDAFAKTRPASVHSDPTRPFERTASEVYVIGGVIGMPGKG